MTIRQKLIDPIIRIPGAVKTYYTVTHVFRKMLFRLQGGTRYGHMFYHPVLMEVLGKAGRRSHISDHLTSIFFFALDAKARLMVELGTGAGESTRVLLAAASITGSTLLSIDVKDCRQLALPHKERWHFVQSDDVEFGDARFTEWCQRNSIEPKIDLLFIDTSHWYEHTKKELQVWCPYLSENAVMILHDTNMGPGVYGRMDGSVGIGYDNERGAIRVLEEFMGRQYDEKSFFCDFARGYLIMHYPHCNGLAVLKKYEAVFSEHDK
jgi:predicted O-methyltransferase YrrM